MASHTLRVRTAASYRITFSDMATLPVDVLGPRIAEVIGGFHGVTEVRVSADTGDLCAYVSIPEDVLPDALDAKAHLLRKRWEAEDVGKPWAK